MFINRKTFGIMKDQIFSCIRAWCPNRYAVTLRKKTVNGLEKIVTFSGLDGSEFPLSLFLEKYITALCLKSLTQPISRRDIVYGHVELAVRFDCWSWLSRLVVSKVSWTGKSACIKRNWVSFLTLLGWRTRRHSSVPLGSFGDLAMAIPLSNWIILLRHKVWISFLYGLWVSLLGLHATFILLNNMIPIIFFS